MSIKKVFVHRQGGAYPLEQARRSFRDYGIIVLKELLPPESKAEMRALLEDKLREASARRAVTKLPQYPKADYLLGDILAIRQLEKYHYIFFAPEVQQVLRALLQSESVLYFGDSSVQYGEAARGFHKDNVDRYDGTKEDWQTEYQLIRCGFYCQDHVTHSGGLKIRLASHNIPTHRKGKILDVTTSYGDLALWNMRLTHSGNNRRLRGFPSVGLHPRLEMVWPEILTIPEEARRIGAFCSFAAPGRQLDRYIGALNAREDIYKPYFQRARKPAELAPLLGGYGVTFQQPNDYYGELD